jgi:hypothetical protein
LGAEVISISEAKDTLKEKNLHRTPINGKFIDRGSADLVIKYQCIN